MDMRMVGMILGLLVGLMSFTGGLLHIKGNREEALAEHQFYQTPGGKQKLANELEIARIRAQVELANAEVQRIKAQSSRLVVIPPNFSQQPQRSYQTQPSNYTFHPQSNDDEIVMGNR